MNRFLKLINFEFNRFWKMYLILIGITILSQIIGVIVEAQNYLGQMNEQIFEGAMPKNEFIEQFGTLSVFRISQTLWFLGPIGLCIAVLSIYVFFIWYRDWFSKNTFIYRLLMLPTSRIHVYLAKAAAILLFIFGLVALQLILIPIESQMLQWMVPTEFRTDLSVYEMTNMFYMTFFFPNSFLEFFLYYSIGTIGIFVLFTSILFERSFRIKGILIAILYVLISVVVFLAPVLVDTFLLSNYLYPMELFFLEVFTGLLVLISAIWIGHYLINKKIRV